MERRRNARPGGEATMAEVTKIGHHEVRYEPDTGFVRIINGGTTEEAEAIAIVDALIKYANIGSTDKAVFVLADVRKLVPTGPKVRRVYATHLPEREMYVVLFGAPFAMRIAYNTLLVTALQMFTKRPFVTEAVADEATARAWLTEQRRAYLARKAR
jgi:hypothetical protein